MKTKEDRLNGKYILIGHKCSFLEMEIISLYLFDKFDNEDKKRAFKQAKDDVKKHINDFKNVFISEVVFEV